MEFFFDASDFLKAYKGGVEDCFIMLYDFTELEAFCDCLGITLNND